MYKQETIKPYGVDGSKREQVEKMFDKIAHSYDTLNHSLSWGIDKYWRNKAIRLLAKQKPESVLDIATGTGDFAIIACKKANPKEVLGVDISEGMMNIGREKVKKEGLDGKISFQKEDCAKMSFSDNRFSSIISAFGVRNFENLDICLKEMHRVLSPGGHLIILELSVPRRFPMKQLFHFYSHVIMPMAGRIISKDASAYTYLPQSMEAFPQAETMKQVLLKAGFRKAYFERLTFGICTMFVAEK
ncbi:MAG: bifunctional demethylmenaquinone methyltransferase/2-methoxy-6-polyprenyl-1,4-benzoquinol methylase UbiE [Bacteroidaceae bacterium]|nr:bifunctional demethylmenaquinone methyltransferase/2-methoxy-6-polyprenyl-1,4-benzoquinol methylase UbiE [Bacteroidaceae bacterium]